MKKNNDRRLTMISLIIAFIALTICYMAYSNTIKIEKRLKTNMSNCNYNYNIGFSLNKDVLLQGSLSPYEIKSSSITPEASNAILKNTIISNIKVNFYSSDAYVIYKFFVHNSSKEDLYLNDIIFENISSTDENKICTPIDIKNSENQIKEACNYIKLGVISLDYSPDIIYNSEYNIGNVKIAKNQSQEINVIISYEKGAPDITIPFKIEFGDIYFKYSTYKSN